MIDGRLLGEDRDALLALEVARVHDPVHDGLVGAEGAGLAQHRVHERGLAVVDVRDDGDVAQVGADRGRASAGSRSGRRARGRAAPWRMGGGLSHGMLDRGQRRALCCGHVRVRSLRGLPQGDAGRQSPLLRVRRRPAGPTRGQRRHPGPAVSRPPARPRPSRSIARNRSDSPRAAGIRSPTAGATSRPAPGSRRSSATPRRRSARARSW